MTSPTPPAEWPASWITISEAAEASLVAAYGLRFSLDQPQTVGFSVSADQRYELFLDGRRIGRGPERGDLRHWYFERYQCEWAAGDHFLFARVWTLDLARNHAPGAQMSLGHAFFLYAEAPHTELLSTGLAPWQGKKHEGYAFTRQCPGAAGAFAGAGVTVNGVDFPWGIESNRDKVPGTPVVRGSTGRSLSTRTNYGDMQFRRLRPALLPPQHSQPVPAGIVRHLDHVSFEQSEDRPILATDHDPASGEAWQQALHGREPVCLGPHQRVRVLIDLENYYCAYAHLRVSGGDGATLRFLWAESPYETGSVPFRDKGHRDEIEGKYLHGRYDTFLPDGSENRTFSPLWWSAGRYVAVFVETAEEPVSIHAIDFEETRYPLEPEGTIDVPHEAFRAALPIMMRTLQMCAHETYMDCPYYEQLMYTGDTRLQMLVTFCVSADSALPRKALTLYASSLHSSGLTQARYPTSFPQIIPGFSLWWIAMLHDYLLWRGEPELVRSFLPTARMILDRYLQSFAHDGALRVPEGWAFVDWVPEWHYGEPPVTEDRIGSIHQLQFVLALGHLADLEIWLGNETLADLRRQQQSQVWEGACQAFWNENVGAFADLPDGDSFSEHAQVLATLSGLLDETQRTRLRTHLLEATFLTPTTVYFRHYLFEALTSLGLAHVMFDRFELWEAFPSLGLRTALEAPEPSRSDCHAWSAHPMYHAVASICGIRPDRPGFAHLRVEPQLGPLPYVRATVPHPLGRIEVDLRQSGDGGLSGTVILPEGLSGTLVANGEIRAITGRTELPAVSQPPR